MRVKQIQETDPAFFIKMLDWKEEFARRRKLWLDKRIEYKERDLITGKITKRAFTVEDAMKMIYDEYLDEDWGLVPA